MSPDRILLCTVGGSAPPIVTAIATLAPQQVVFVCSTDDLATGKPGTRAAAADIAGQAGLDANRQRFIEIPADDLDAAHAALSDCIAELRRASPDATLLADYTGGTKTMSAALVCVAIENGVQLCLTTGPRNDHSRVTRGEDTALLSPEGLSMRRTLRHVEQLWQRHAYAEAVTLLSAAPAPQAPPLRARLQRQRALSAAFAAWDDFDHAAAHEQLGPYVDMLKQALAPYMGTLATLTKPTHRHREPLQIIDLWRNAQRRAVQGRYDDAVARLYRLLEWTAQWLLKHHLAIDTVDVPAERIPDGISIEPSREGRRSAGLFVAWALLAHHRPQSPAGRFFLAEKPKLLDHLKCRNHSILAHGFTPIGPADWRAMASWVEDRLIPVIQEESELKSLSAQLPASPLQYLT